MQVAFLLAGEITQVKESIPWVRCASGNVLHCVMRYVYPILSLIEIYLYFSPQNVYKPKVFSSGLIHLSTVTRDTSSRHCEVEKTSLKCFISTTELNLG